MAGALAAVDFPQWRGPNRDGVVGSVKLNAAILLAGDLLFLLNTDAELIVAKVSPTSFQAVKTYTVAESETWAHPLVLSEGIVIKDFESLTLWTV